MILLDTNVVSEPLKAPGDMNVLAWIDAQIIETLYLSAISLAELRFGVAVLPEGKRRDLLHQRLEQRVLPLFAGRILSFDAPASDAYATLRSRARRWESDCAGGWLHRRHRGYSWLRGSHARHVAF